MKLLEKALQKPAKSMIKKVASADEIELVTAWAKGEISMSQVDYAMKDIIKKGSASYFLLRVLKQIVSKKK